MCLDEATRPLLANFDHWRLAKRVFWLVNLTKPRRWWMKTSTSSEMLMGPYITFYLTAVQYPMYQPHKELKLSSGTIEI